MTSPCQWLAGMVDTARAGRRLCTAPWVSGILWEGALTTFVPEGLVRRSVQSTGDSLQPRDRTLYCPDHTGFSQCDGAGNSHLLMPEHFTCVKFISLKCQFLCVTVLRMGIIHDMLLHICWWGETCRQIKLELSPQPTVLENMPKSKCYDYTNCRHLCTA